LKLTVRLSVATLSRWWAVWRIWWWKLLW